jgi:hypothetical protein
MPRPPFTSIESLWLLENLPSSLSNAGLARAAEVQLRRLVR